MTLPDLGEICRSFGSENPSLGPVQNIFGSTSTTNKAAAEALVDAYATANASWFAQYDANRGLVIQLLWTGGGEAFQRRNVAGDDWEDVTSIVRGPQGQQGSTGAGTVVVANPTGADGDDLDRIAIGGTNYNITGGGGASGAGEILYDDTAGTGFSVASNSSSWNTTERFSLKRALTADDDNKILRVFGFYTNSGNTMPLRFEIPAELFRLMTAITPSVGPPKVGQNAEGTLPVYIQRPESTGDHPLSGFGEGQMHVARFRDADDNDGIWLNVGSKGGLEELSAVKLKVVLV